MKKQEHSLELSVKVTAPERVTISDGGTTTVCNVVVILGGQNKITKDSDKFRLNGEKVEPNRFLTFFDLDIHLAFPDGSTAPYREPNGSDPIEVSVEISDAPTRELSFEKNMNLYFWDQKGNSWDATLEIGDSFAIDIVERSAARCTFIVKRWPEDDYPIAAGG
jgi:hypothetical protein